MATAWELRMTASALHAAAKRDADNTALLNQLHLLIISLPPSTRAIIVDGAHWKLSGTACTRLARAFSSAACRTYVTALYMGPTPLTTSAAEAICRALPMLTELQMRIVGPKAGLLTGKRCVWRPAIDMHRLQTLELRCVKGGNGNSRASIVMDLQPLMYGILLRQLWLQAGAFECVGVVAALPHLERLRVELMGLEGADMRAGVPGCSGFFAP